MGLSGRESNRNLMDIRELAGEPSPKPQPRGPIVSFPWMGHDYTILMKEAMESLGLRVILPPKISEATIKLGVRHSSDMACFPYKTTLGNFIEVLDQGANIILMYDNRGQCRQRHYWKLHELTLRNLGYEFEIYPISRDTLIPVLTRISGKSKLAIMGVYATFARKLKELDQRYQWSKDQLNIGIIGEIYTCCEETVNYGVEKKLRGMGVNPVNTSSLLDFFSNDMNLDVVKLLLDNPNRNTAMTDEGIFVSSGHGPEEKKIYKEMASEYLNGPVGGHGFENLYNLLWMKDKGVAGVIHLLPLSCLTGDTTVITEGYLPKPIKDIEVDDRVLTHNGQIKPVTSIFNRAYDGEMFHVDCGGLLNLNITPNHHVLLLKRQNIACKKSFEPEFLPISDAEVGDFMLKISNTEGIRRLKDETLNVSNRMNNARSLELDDCFLIPIKELSKTQFSGMVYNLEVSEDNSYVANNLAVHNCMPETTVEPIINHICQKENIPLLRLPIDETNSEANVDTRLETFVELIKRKPPTGDIHEMLAGN